ncbi:uncharacterized protein TRIADDRAFT_61347 [Trichoplax adhaerens]|uniref:Peripheral subunit-binding (PSBD) domain-containing protein n=1 Tax=Trichoplax adhaerens TaxID=10228 RepID=B3SAR0_TRIAD|nr:hypothetical protein TRIADDRAFT_61347 [Trichoplax adhaerens]EDV20144.1 hypothetical protein TRIADDRAFT_61347 [Trichoplax adhaerens]|eukprot:XP_002117305.1 hypothetical protein TRIADDRAFT_61347 [Trichoplax adhaerens]
MQQTSKSYGDTVRRVGVADTARTRMTSNEKMSITLVLHARLSYLSPILSPAVRRLIETHKIDPNQVTATGRNGRILKGDVLAYLESKDFQSAGTKVESVRSPPKPLPPIQSPKMPKMDKSVPMPNNKSSAGYVDIENTQSERSLARKVTESKWQVPQAYVVVDCYADNLAKFCKDMADLEITMDSLIVKAAILALKTNPDMNVALVDDEVQSLPRIDISLSTWASRTKITRPLFDATSLRVSEIASKLKLWQSHSKENQLEDSTAGSFNITCMSSMGIKSSTAIVLPPTSAVLTVGSVNKIICEDGYPIDTVAATLSFDARLIDEPCASQFMTQFRFNVEDPSSWLLR